MALLPDPAPRQRQHVVISVDDHLIEPPDLFEGRMPAELADRAPQVVETDDGRQAWVYEDAHLPEHRAQRGRRPPEGRVVDGAGRFDEMRRGCWDIDARIADMDLDGVCASLCFPSLIAGFAGTVFCREQGPGARPRLRAGVERLAPRRVGRHATRIASSRSQLAVAADPEIAADRGPAQRRARLQGGQLPRDTRPTSACRRCTPATGTRSSRPARRPTPSSACTPDRRSWAPVPCAGHAVRAAHRRCSR